MSASAPWGRREFLGAGTLLALCVGLPAMVASWDTLDEEDSPSERQRELMALVADLVIPRTDTPGASDVGTGDFVLLALSHGLSGTRNPVAHSAITPDIAPFLRRDGSLRHANWLERTLNRAGNGDFLRLSPAQRATTLGRIDAAAMAQGAPWSPWAAIKGLILTGYYTSEIGGSRELRYELVPGRFDPDLPLLPSDRAWSSDWTAVEFG